MLPRRTLSGRWARYVGRFSSCRKFGRAGERNRLRDSHRGLCECGQSLSYLYLLSYLSSVHTSTPTLDFALTSCARKCSTSIIPLTTLPHRDPRYSSDQPTLGSLCRIYGRLRDRPGPQHPAHSPATALRRALPSLLGAVPVLWRTAPDGRLHRAVHCVPVYARGVPGRRSICYQGECVYAGGRARSNALTCVSSRRMGGETTRR